MKLTFITLYILLVLEVSSQERYKALSVAFWNVENLFDTINDPKKWDDDFTPDGKFNWNTERYHKKLDHLAKVISQIGEEQTKRPPAILGMCEVENKAVLEDLINHPTLKDFNYEIIHRNSPDERGIDVAMIYRKELFKPKSYYYYHVLLENDGQRDFTRDIMTVKGKLDDEDFYFIFNHWPSRSGGEKRSAPNRLKAAQVARRYVDSIQLADPKAKIILMGDFNDDPNNVSLKKYLGACDVEDPKGKCSLYNLTYPLFKKGIGTLAYYDSWNLFDQIIVSSQVQLDTDGYRAFSAQIFNPKYLQTSSGRFAGYPFRTYAGGTYMGGYADHFPPFLILVKPDKN